MARLSSPVSFDARFQCVVDCLVLLGTDTRRADRVSNMGEFWEILAMRRKRRRPCVAVASVRVMCFSHGLSGAQDPDTLLCHTLPVPEVIHRALARNPACVAARTGAPSCIGCTGAIAGWPHSVRSIVECPAGAAPNRRAFAEVPIPRNLALTATWQVVRLTRPNE